MVSSKQLEGIPKKYDFKIYEIGNIINKEIINFSENITKINNEKRLSILVLGGSQAAKIFAETLPKIFKECSKKIINLKIFQQCMPNQNEFLREFYEKAKIEFEIFNFSFNLTEYFSKTNLAITRSGSSMLAELTNANIPFISVPLPSSADNHQLKNASYYQKNNLSFLIEEKDLNTKLYNLINDICQNRSLLNKIKMNQRQYSDKNVYKNINQVLREIIDEKINLGQNEIIHFLGIGGIGMSGLAQIIKNMGYKIQGSDQSKNKNTITCANLGIKVFIGHSVKNLKNSTIIVRSSAIKNSNIEIKYAIRKKIPIYSRAEVLADIVSLKKNIIITGSHGKTTTTSLVSKILSDQKLDPTIINGGVINSLIVMRNLERANGLFLKQTNLMGVSQVAYKLFHSYQPRL